MRSLAIVVMALIVCLSWAQPKENANADLTVLYALDQVLPKFKHDPLPGIPGWAAPEEFADKISAEAIAQLIIQSVEPQSWKANGGSGEIVVIGDRMLVRTSADNKELVDDFLSAFQTQQGKRICITADWLLLSAADYLALVRAMSDQEEKYIELMDELIHTAFRLSGEVVAYNGQTVHLISGTRRQSIEQVKTIVSAEAKSFQPDPLYFRNDGFALQVTPRLRDGNVVQVDVHSYLSSTSSIRMSTLIPPSGAAVPSITRNIAHTTARMKLNRPTIVAVMNRNPRFNDGDNQIVCLVLKASLLSKPSRTEDSSTPEKEK